MISQYIVFYIGFLIAFIPFFVFEFRHGFSQIKVALTTITTSHAVVGQVGLSKAGIITTFFGRLTDIFQISQNLIPEVYGMIILFIVYAILAKKIKLSNFDKKLLLYLVCCSIGILGLYLTSRNPVWGYHFLGVEVIFLLILGLIASKITYFRYFLIFITILVSIYSLSIAIKSWNVNPLAQPNLITKEKEVKIISSDAKNSNYTVFAYSPSIYTYDYAYLFPIIAHKDLPYDPNTIQGGGSIVYLLIQPAKASIKEDFINHRTPNSLYKTAKAWQIPDGTIIIKRVKIQH